jgi:hypothetical protein
VEAARAVWLATLFLGEAFGRGVMDWDRFREYREALRLLSLEVLG